MDEDKPDPFATESIVRMFVDKEKSGFDQCRNKLLGFVDRRIEELPEPVLSEDWPYYEGKEDAYKDILEYLRGVEK